MKLGIGATGYVALAFFLVGAVLADLGAGLIIAYAFASCGIFLTAARILELR